MSTYFSQQVHHVPGRLRLKLAAIKRNEAHARCAEHQLGALDGVRSACANPLTGSLVVRFDPCITSVDNIFDTLKTQGLLDAGAVPPATPGNSARYAAAAMPLLPSASLADVIVSKAIETVLERCAVALVVALI